MATEVNAVAEADGLVELAGRLAAYCREHLAGFKCPRSSSSPPGNCGRPAGKIPPRPAAGTIRRGPGSSSPDISGITPTDFTPRATRMRMDVAAYPIDGARCHIHAVSPRHAGGAAGSGRAGKLGFPSFVAVIDKARTAAADDTFCPEGADGGSQAGGQGGRDRFRARGGRLSEDATPLVSASRGSAGERVLLWCVAAALRASLIVTPRPTALLVRRLFAAGGAQTTQALARHAPPGVIALTDERYGDEDDMVLDVVRPAAAGGRLPLVLWVHGGGWVGGSKDELAGYFKLIASHGYVVAGPRYSLAPEHRYPTPPRQMMRALEYLQANADRYQIDPDRIAIGGDSAGAQIAAQLGAPVTTPDTPRPSASARPSPPRSYAASSWRAARTTSNCSAKRAPRQAAAWSRPSCGPTRAPVATSTTPPLRHQCSIGAVRLGASRAGPPAA